MLANWFICALTTAEDFAFKTMSQPDEQALGSETAMQSFGDVQDSASRPMISF